jgi:hypothetical protein
VSSALAFLAAIAAGCASSAPVGAPPKTEQPMAVSPVLRFLPVAEGKIWAYDAEDEESGGKGVFVTRARHLTGSRFSLTTGERTRVLEARADGIAYAEGEGYLLRAPLSAGAEWRGEHGSVVRVSAVDTVVKVPAGTFAGCVETIEQPPSAGSPPARQVTTSFCPDVGIASLRVEAWDQGRHIGERAVLRSFGDPVTIVK